MIKPEYIYGKYFFYFGITRAILKRLAIFTTLKHILALFIHIWKCIGISKILPYFTSHRVLFYKKKIKKYFWHGCKWSHCRIHVKMNANLKSWDQYNLFWKYLNLTLFCTIPVQVPQTREQLNIPWSLQ